MIFLSLFLLIGSTVSFYPRQLRGQEYKGVGHVEKVKQNNDRLLLLLLVVVVLMCFLFTEKNLSMRGVDEMQKAQRMLAHHTVHCVKLLRRKFG